MWRMTATRASLAVLPEPRSPLMELPSEGVAADRRQRGHVQDGAQRTATCPDRATLVPAAAVPGVRRHTGKAGDLLAA